MNRTILLADDSLTIQKVVELTFADTEYSVVAVSSGDELLLQLPECKPDIVICDVIMPGRDGYDVCQEIKSNPGSLHLPVILLTGTFEPFDRDRALAAGCSEIITKPFEARKLVEAVEKLTGEPVVESFAESSVAQDFGYDDQPDAPPVFPAPEEAVEHDFGTHLTDAATPLEEEGNEEVSDPREELEFTASGFAEMEEAGREQQDAAFSPPEEGLEFEFGDDAVSTEDEHPEPMEEQLSTDTAPLPEPLSVTPEELSVDDVAGATVDEEDGSPFANIEEEDYDQPPEFAEEVDDEAVTSTEEVEELLPDTEYYEERLTEPIETIPELAGEEKGWQEVVPDIEEEAPPEEAPDIDTQDITEDVAQLADRSEDSLSDEDVDRIARRLLELAGDRIEQIAWDVIPDMAELVVRERVREIEVEAGHVAAEPTQ